MKKVLLASVAALAVFSAAAPVFAQGENSASSNQLLQKKYVSERDIADEANTQVAAHDAEIRAEAQRQFDQTAAAAVKAAEGKLKAFLDSGYSDHDFTDKKNALEAEVTAAKAKGEQAYNEIYNTVRNRYVQKLQEQYRAAAKAQGNYWNDPTGVEDNKPNSTRIAEDQANQTGQAASAAQAAADQAATKPEDGKPGAVDQAKKADAAAKKAGANAKAGQKALPKTHAAK
ncbi:amylase-binding adhesin AbpA [Streptococcus sp. 27098_8_69]|uniref:amylase-binding adhesin AbpA n=1 Tax=Streptococcus sp. 27098_8_69 TaxID=3003664 RepID=UPI00352F0CD5